MNTRFYSLLLYFPLLFACQSNQTTNIIPVTPPINLYLDSEYISLNPIHIETEEEIFQLDNEMRAMVQAKLINNLSAQKKAYTLLKHLFNDENIALTYDGNANITASQVYHGKVANCMSLTILAYALADEAGMNISFQEVEVPEYWVRNGQYNLLTGHVNLLVKESEDVNRRIVWGNKTTKIDFDPFVAKKSFPSHIITKQTLSAMFYNNKGADALIDHNYPLAYQYLKQATLTDNYFSSAWGNLGILYKFSGQYDMAEKVYSHAISLNKENLTSLSNLALLLNMQGRISEAQPIEDYIHKVRVKNPYYHTLLGNEAYFSKSYQQALQHYKKAIDLDDEQHEFFLALAKVYYMQGKLVSSQNAIKKAIALTKAKETKELYIAKLNFLKYQETVHN